MKQFIKRINAYLEMNISFKFCLSSTFISLPVVVLILNLWTASTYFENSLKCLHKPSFTGQKVQRHLFQAPEQGQIHYARKFEHYAFGRHPQNNSITPKIMLKKYHYDRLIMALFDSLFYACRRKNTFVSLKHNRLQNSPYFCVFKYARAVNKRSGTTGTRLRTESETGERKTDCFAVQKHNIVLHHLQIYKK